jgi:Flp pilus assembly protein TadD
MRAMLLSPTAPEPHLYAARCLAAGGQDQLARREYRLAILLGRPAALEEAARHFPALDDLLRIAPDTPDGLMALAWLLWSSRKGDSAKVLTLIWRDYRDPRALGPLAEAKLADGDPEEALALARALEGLGPGEAQGYLVAAAALDHLDRGEEAQKELELGAGRVPGSLPVLRVLVRRSLASRRFAHAHSLAERITARSSSELAKKRLLIAEVLAAQERLAEAIDEARGARSAAPQEPESYLELADYCARAGRYEEAIAAVRGAAALPGTPKDAYVPRLRELEASRDAHIRRMQLNQLEFDPKPTQLP